MLSWSSYSICCPPIKSRWSLLLFSQSVFQYPLLWRVSSNSFHRCFLSCLWVQCRSQSGKKTPGISWRRFMHRIITLNLPFLLFTAKRPPVEETASFLQSLIASHGPNYLEKLFGNKARDALAPLGGVEKVAVALSESQTIEDFGAALHLMRWVREIQINKGGAEFMRLIIRGLFRAFFYSFSLVRSDLEHLRSVFMAVENGDLGMLKSLGIKDSELGDVKFFLEKLVNTGFLDWEAPEESSPFYYTIPISFQISSFFGNGFSNFVF